MEKIYLIKMYIKWNNQEVPTSKYRWKAKTIMAFKSKKRALETLVDLHDNAKTTQCSLYKKYFFIEEMKLQ